MDITFTKLSDARHRVRITRDDGSAESAELETRDFLRHDLAHFAAEQALAIRRGFWGSVAAGAPLSGAGIDGQDAALAEGLAGPVQTLMREDAGVDDYLALLRRVAPQRASRDLAADIHERIRQLRGRWKATHFGGEMCLRWEDGAG